MSIGDEGPYMNDHGDVWVPRTVRYLDARRVARDAMNGGSWERLVYVGKSNAELLGFTRDCHCDEVCELAQRCAACGHDHSDYEGQCWFDECVCMAHIEPAFRPCAAPAWHFKVVER